MDILIYMGVFILICGVIVGGIWISKKYNIDKKDYEFVLVLLGMVNYVTSQFEWKYKEGIADVLELVIEAVDIVKETQDITDIMLLKQYALNEAKALCKDKGIKVDAEFEEMLFVALDYLLM